jgi:serine/threonine-protein kinase
VPESQWQTQAAALGIPGDFLDRLVQETMGSASIPSSATQTLQYLQQGLATLSLEARVGMGTYYRRDYDRWLATLTDLKLNAASVEALADAYFANHFPESANRSLNPRTSGQIWYAIAHDQIHALRQKNNLVTLAAQPGHHDQVLNYGQGQIYQIRLGPQQTLAVQLDTPTSGLRLSVIQDGRWLLKNSADLNWSAPATHQATIYEVVLTPTRLDKIAYRLRLQVSAKG